MFDQLISSLPSPLSTWLTTPTLLFILLNLVIITILFSSSSSSSPAAAATAPHDRLHRLRSFSFKRHTFDPHQQHNLDPKDDAFHTPLPSPAPKDPTFYPPSTFSSPKDPTFDPPSHKARSFVPQHQQFNSKGDAFYPPSTFSTPKDPTFDPPSHKARTFDPQDRQFNSKGDAFYPPETFSTPKGRTFNPQDYSLDTNGDAFHSPLPSPAPKDTAFFPPPTFPTHQDRTFDPPATFSAPKDRTFSPSTRQGRAFEFHESSPAQKGDAFGSQWMGLVFDNEETEQPINVNHHHLGRSHSETHPTKAMPSSRAMKKSASENSMSAHFEDEEESGAVDARADDFISRFKQQLKLQRLESLLRYRATKDD